ncbi:SDR family NAD(P)-dependent oxidoreductase [Thaumasiovibrio subtropicus]|uniref:SDR family NAD(P)-dependent oxidoreductase n=1 Tax=Thaumasiovibrio subtropicus TaxID=1891207 RepID=UPI000B34C518|nr:SDR family NAD(P)-dependent oxidoreductase [Thaumasiovibrio subtropicus]
MQKVTIIGGTKGIGLALAQHYAQQGRQVTVWGRDESHVITPQRYEFPIAAVVVDITDRTAYQHQLAQLVSAPPDLLIYCAAYYEKDDLSREDRGVRERMRRVCLEGMVEAFSLVGAAMVTRGRGHLVAISSIAGLLRPETTSYYGRLKRAMIQQAQVFQHALGDEGIKVTCAIPGYVDTARLRELNGDDLSSKPFVVSQQRAVAEITKAIAIGAHQVIFPRRMLGLARLLNRLPASWVIAIQNKRSR